MNQSILSSKFASCLRLVSSHIPIRAVVDVGVQSQTIDLMRAFPHVHHHLFEPVSLWHEAIKANYRHVMHTLYPCALAESNRSAYITELSINGDGKSTHATINERPARPDGIKIVRCSAIDIHRLDFFSDQFPDDFLLKIDVDGVELDVLKGASDCIHRASVLIIEAPYWELAQRAAAVEQFEFQLVDIVDRVMYGHALYQCDLVYVRSDLVGASLLRPKGDFSPGLWLDLP